MKLTITKSGVFLDDQKVQNCTRVDVENISPINGMEVVLHVHVDEADIHYCSFCMQKEGGEESA